jgi:hypothetical protein
MVKVIGPMMSLTARGKFADTLIYARTFATNYTKPYAIPDNPRSPAQTITRLGTGALTKAWKNLSTAQQAAWEPYATRWNLTTYHAYLKENCCRWRDDLPWLPTPKHSSIYGILDDTLEFTRTGDVFHFFLKYEIATFIPFIAQVAAAAGVGDLPSKANTILLLTNPLLTPYYATYTADWTTPDGDGRYFHSRLHMPTGSGLPIVTPWQAIDAA